MGVFSYFDNQKKITTQSDKFEKLISYHFFKLIIKNCKNNNIKCCIYNVLKEKNIYFRTFEKNKNYKFVLFLFNIFVKELNKYGASNILFYLREKDDIGSDFNKNQFQEYLEQSNYLFEILLFIFLKILKRDFEFKRILEENKNKLSELFNAFYDKNIFYDFYKKEYNSIYYNYLEVQIKDEFNLKVCLNGELYFFIKNGWNILLLMLICLFQNIIH